MAERSEVVSALDTAWQDALAGEHEAAYGYSLLGPQLRGADLDRAVACSNAHESLRNATEEAMVRAGIVPIQSRADYPALYPVKGADGARALAVRLEDECAAGWRALFAAAAATDSALARTLLGDAQAALVASARRATHWRIAAADAVPTVAFPGID